MSKYGRQTADFLHCCWFQWQPLHAGLPENRIMIYPKMQVLQNIFQIRTVRIGLYPIFRHAYFQILIGCMHILYDQTFVSTG